MSALRSPTVLSAVAVTAIGVGGVLAWQRQATPAPEGVDTPPPAAAPAGPPPAYGWVQLGAGTTASARVVLESPGATCPDVVVDGGAPVPMSPRAAGAGFTSITVCERALNGYATSITVQSTPPMTLPAPTGAAGAALLLGDTGCRLQKGSPPQPCAGGDPSHGGWGFPALSAAAAKGGKADFILHVGDYIYRERTQTSDPTRCDPYDPSRGWERCGYGWAVWKDDFLEPARAGGLLTLAPWIFVRGNHESCSRAWLGYFLLFGDGPVPSACLATIPPYAAALQGLTVHVVDTSSKDPASAERSFIAVDQALTAGPAWLTTHVPTHDPSVGDAWARGRLSENPNLTWLLVGHVHNFQHTPRSSTQQAETLLGGGGTSLDGCGAPQCTSGSAGACCLGLHATHGGADAYTWVTAAANAGGGWTATLHDLQGDALPTFTLP